VRTSAEAGAGGGGGDTGCGCAGGGGGVYQNAKKTERKVSNQQGAITKKIVFLQGILLVDLYITQTLWISNKFFFVSLWDG